MPGFRSKPGFNAPAVRPHARVWPVAADHIFEGCQLFGADRSARVQLVGGDADLGAEAELAAVGELRRGVDHHDGGVDPGA